MIAAVATDAGVTVLLAVIREKPGGVGRRGGRELGCRLITSPGVLT